MRSGARWAAPRGTLTICTPAVDGEKVRVEASGLNTPQLLDKLQDSVAQVRHRQWLGSLSKKPPQYPE